MKYNNCIHQTARSVAALRASLLVPLVMHGVTRGSAEFIRMHEVPC